MNLFSCSIEREEKISIQDTRYDKIHLPTESFAALANVNMRFLINTDCSIHV